MLLVNALCVPLADPFTSEFVKRNTLEARQRLLNHLTLFTTTVLVSLAAAIVVAWWLFSQHLGNIDLIAIFFGVSSSIIGFHINR